MAIPVAITVSGAKDGVRFVEKDNTGFQFAGKREQSLDELLTFSDPLIVQVCHALAVKEHEPFEAMIAHWMIWTRDRE